MLRKIHVPVLLFTIFLMVLTVNASFANGTPTSDYLKDLQANDRFTRDDKGIITDKSTGFQWMEGPDRAMDYNQVLAWVKTLGSDWRTPTMKELHTICVPGAVRPAVDPKAKPVSKVKVQLHSAFKLGTAWTVWSSDIYNGKELKENQKNGSFIWYFCFREDVAKKEHWTNRDYNDYNYRGFAIRTKTASNKKPKTGSKFNFLK
ncbi:MAG: DUF1566 domain-containing protein [Candidatus Riflebacteria bacterium]|nr:DUF1566 domain-containing protein [Candidatus Riflebacteria bacterium]